GGGLSPYPRSRPLSVTLSVRQRIPEERASLFHITRDATSAIDDVALSDCVGSEPASRMNPLRIPNLLHTQLSPVMSSSHEDSSAVAHWASDHSNAPQPELHSLHKRGVAGIEQMWSAGWRGHNKGQIRGADLVGLDVAECPP